MKFVEDLKSRRLSLDSLDEAATRQAVIGKLLYLLGWDIFNVDEVVPEYPIGETNIDYALKTGMYNDKVFIEVKRIREDLTRHQEQLLNYCFKEGVKYAILTNGMIWWFYLPLSPLYWEERRFYTIDIVQQDSKEVASKLIEFLSRENINNGNAIKSASLVGPNPDLVLRDILPKAWDNIITEHNNKLIELIIEVTQNVCRLKPDVTTVKRFLSGHEYHLKTIGVGIQISKVPNSDEKQQTKVPIVTDSRPIEGQQSQNRVKISSFYFAGSKYEVDTWKGLLMKILEIIYSKHGSDFNKVLDIPGRKRQYFSYDPQTLGTAVKVGDTNICVEVKLGYEGIKRLCYDVINLFGYSEEDLQIETK